MERREASSAIERLDPGRRLWVSPAARSSLLGEDRALLWIGGLRQVVQGRSARLVPKLLERIGAGEFAEAAIAAVAGSEGCSTEEVSRVLDVLWARGVVDEEDPGSEGAADESTEIAAQTRYLSLFTSRPHRALAALSGATVDLFVVPELAARLTELLRASGVGAVRAVAPLSQAIREPAPASSCGGRSSAVVVARSLEEEWVLPLNDTLVSEGRGFVAALLSGGSARIGPAVLPRESACLRCVHEVDRRLVPPLPDGVRLPPAPPVATEPVPLLDLVAASLALEVVKSLTGLFVPALANRRLLVEATSLGVEYEVLVKLPRCPSCGRAAGHAETEAFDTAAALPAPAAGQEV